MYNGKLGLLNASIPVEYVWKKTVKTNINPIEELFCDEEIKNIPITKSIMNENGSNIEFIKQHSFDKLLETGEEEY